MSYNTVQQAYKPREMYHQKIEIMCSQEEALSRNTWDLIKNVLQWQLMCMCSVYFAQFDSSRGVECCESDVYGTLTLYKAITFGKYRPVTHGEHQTDKHKTDNS